MNAAPGTGDLTGQIVLVTGGVRGLGRAITTAFAARGAHVIVNYFHATDEAPKFLAELQSHGGSAELIRASVANKSQVTTMFEQIAATHGRLDVLVNNAAAGALLPLSELDESHWDRAFNTNLRGSLWCAQQAAPLISANGGGAIVNVSSLGSSLVISNYATVGTSKAAVESLTRYLAVEYASQKIRVNTASGGLLDGSVTRLFPDSDQLVEQVREATPLANRLGTEEELAELVLFLASPAASWITGQTVVADGGLSLGASLLSPSPGKTGQTHGDVQPNSGGGPVDRPLQTESAGSSLTAKSLQDRENRPTKRNTRSARSNTIAIVGMGLVTPGANNPQQFQGLLDGEHHVFAEPELFDIESFYSADPSAEDRSYTKHSGFIRGFTPHPQLLAEIKSGTLPSQESTTMWLRHSLYTSLEGIRRRSSDRHFVAIGFTADGSQALEESLVLAGLRARLAAGDRIPSQLLTALDRRYNKLGTPPHNYLPRHIGHNAIVGLVPEHTELLTVDTACSSSLYSVDLGIKALRDGDCDIAICGGAFAYSARNLVLFSKLHGLSRSGEVRSFDRDASGVLFSDGAGFVALKDLNQARADGDPILATIESVGLSCDGKGKAIYAPNQVGQAFALQRAFESSTVDAESLCWVIAHATGTQAGDSTEVASLHQVAGNGPPALLSSNKSIVGHTGWTAGLVSLVQAINGLQSGVVSAQRYLRNPIDDLKNSRFTPPRSQTQLRNPGGNPRRVGISSFGFGGTNAHLVLADPPADKNPLQQKQNRLVSNEDICIVGWAVDVPGESDAEAATQWLHGNGKPPALTFGPEYPMPSFKQVPLPPATLRNMDRSQIMVLQAASRLSTMVSEFLAKHNDTTGVIAAHYGPTRRGVHYALRCYLADVHKVATDMAPDGLTGEVQHQLAELNNQIQQLVPASTEDSFPGIMPNLIPARLASLANYHGLNATIDTGPDGGISAIRTAERYLRHGNLDCAVVVGVNGNTTEEFAQILASGGSADQLAEGAFMLVLVRESTAIQANLPILGRVRTHLGSAKPENQPRRMSPLTKSGEDSGRSYLAADSIVATIAAIGGGEQSLRISSTEQWGPQLDVAVGSSTPLPQCPHETVERSSSSPVARTIRRLVPKPSQQVRDQLPVLPPNTLVIASDPSMLATLELPSTVVGVVSPTAPQDLNCPLPDPEELLKLLPDKDFEISHVRVIVNIGASTTEPEDLSALHQLRVAHDMAFLAAQRWTAVKGSSFGVLLLDSVTRNTPHPSTGIFTGLVKSLSREAFGGLAFAVLTDFSNVQQGLQLVAMESANHHDLAVVVHAGNQRLSYVLDPAPLSTSDRTDQSEFPLNKDSVVVAAGGTRGLTAEILHGLAKKSSPTIYLLGRTTPSTDELPMSRADFLTHQRSVDPLQTIAELSAQYDKKLAAVETHRTMKRLTGVCGQDRVHHLQCDLADPEAVFSCIDRISGQHGKIDLLINAGGVHHGGTIRQTPLATARKVRDTKLLAYLNLRAAFAGREPVRWYNFGSLLAVLGWPGEADYCAGNDVLNAGATWRRKFFTDCETTIAWSLWDETGFAAQPVTRELLRRQGSLTALSNQDGVSLFLAELASNQSDSMITFLGEAEGRLLDRESLKHVASEASVHRQPTSRAAFMLKPAVPTFNDQSPSAEQKIASWRLSGDRDTYLSHHLLNGIPTLPGAFLAELAAQAADPTQTESIVELRNLKFSLPIREIQGNDPDYQVVIGKPTKSGGLTNTQCRVNRDVIAPNGKMLVRKKLHAEMEMLFSHKLPTMEANAITAHNGLPIAPQFYQPDKHIYVSGPFVSLANVIVGTTSATARFSPPHRDVEIHCAHFRLPVLLIDAAIQLALLSRSHGAAGQDRGQVPTGIDKVRLFTNHNDKQLLSKYGNDIVLQTVSATTGHKSGVIAIAPDNTVLIAVYGIREHTPAAITDNQNNPPLLATRR